MKKMLLVSLLMIIIMTVSLPAQIIISSNPYNPPVGTLLRGSSADITESFYNNVTSGSGGGHLWDFSSILFSIEDTTFVVDCASSPVVGSFPSANLCFMGYADGDSTWIYNSSVPGSFQTLGIFTQLQGMDDITIIYDDTAPDYVFPIAMNNSWIAYRHWTQAIAPGTEISNADSTFYEVEAYGLLKYGNSTVDCLRIKSTERVWSTTSVGGVPFITNVVEIERYDFVTADYLDALSVLKTVTGLGTFYGAGANLNSLDQQTPVVEYDQSVLPDQFRVGQNYPNPFNPSTSINYGLPNSAEVTMEIINIAGQRVKSFDLGYQPAGNHTITIDLIGDLSSQLSSGVYFYKISAGNFSQTRKMMLLK